MVHRPTPRPAHPPRLTAPQLAVLRVLWERSEATVTDVQQALHAGRPLAATTIATLVSQLLSSHELRSGDLAKVKALIEAKEQEARKRRRL